MAGFDEGIDPALRVEFIDESLDGLEQVSELFVELEANPDNTETIQAIFRPVHSIKGNSAYFGLLRTKTLAHEMETVLDQIRKGALSPTSEITDTLLQGTDELKAILGRVRADEAEIADVDGFELLVQQVRSLAGGAKASEESLWKTLLAQLRQGVQADLLASAEHLAHLSAAGRRALGQGMEAGGRTAAVPEPVNALRQILLHASAPDLAEVKHQLGALSKFGGTPKFLAGIEEMLFEAQMLADTVGLNDPVARESLLAHLDTLGTASSIEVEHEARPASPAAQAESGAAEAAKGKPAGKTMRVPEDRIDAFLSHVGDLVTVGEMYTHLCGNLLSGQDGRTAAVELRRINDSFNDLSRALQSSIMGIRKQSMNTILQRAPRMVRDIAVARGKDIETRVVGGEVLADKSLVDTLEAPLTHMVRNAADHGIESPQEREACGKPRSGLIEIKAVETPDDIILTVKDDGKGIDHGALRAKALEMGLIARDATLTESDIVSLLFRSGVSTAAEVTDVSGRGVGMDVVKRAIEQMGGRIAVLSESGKGAEFSVRLPKTVSTQILTGFIVLVAGNRYVFPLETIVRCFRPAHDDLVTLQGKGECVKDGSRMLRVCRLLEAFQIGSAIPETRSCEKGIMVVVETKARSVAVHVDAIEGVRQVVLKDIDESTCADGLFLGAAVMGDGAVAMILNVEQIVESGHSA